LANYLWLLNHVAWSRTLGLRFQLPGFQQSALSLPTSGFGLWIALSGTSSLRF
jgi:hypothetical protein